MQSNTFNRGELMRKFPSGGEYAIARRVYRKLKRLRAPVASDFSSLRRRVTEATDQVSPKRILLVSSNGAGLGHLSRLNAISDHLPGEVLFYTMSSAYHRLNKKQSEIIYFPSYGDLGMDGSKWNPLMEAHFTAVVEGYRPTAIVFDGTYVYNGVSAVAKRKSIPLVWIQRGCWKPEVAEKSLQRKHPERYVDMVIVPGDYGYIERKRASSVPVSYVSPIVTVDREHLLPREDAIKDLGLPGDKKYFLLQVGAGVINDTGDTIKMAVTAVRELGDEWEPVMVRNPLKDETRYPAVRRIEAFPLSKYLNAFEAGIFAAGYNSVQEAVCAALPAVFVPNLETKTDDQGLRARGMSDRGLGFVATNFKQIRAAIQRLGNDRERQGIQQRLAEVYERNGSYDAARLIEDLPTLLN